MFSSVSMRVKIQRSWTYGRVEDVKTEGSEKSLDTNLADILRRHREGMTDTLLETGWVFVSPFTGKPWWAHKLVRYHLRPAAEKAKIGRIGWHTFRHTYSTLLHAYGTDMKVQREGFAERLLVKPRCLPAQCLARDGRHVSPFYGSRSPVS